MSWASHPTNEMPATSATRGRHRRRRSSVIGISAAVALLGLAVAGAMLSPTLLGWPPPNSQAAAEFLPGRSAPGDGRNAALLMSTTSPQPAAAPSRTLTTTPPAPTKTAPTERSPMTTSVATGMQSLEDEVVRLTNVERASNGCVALRADSKLRTAARDHSAEMAANQELTHTGADGSSPDSRMEQAGYDPDWGWAENVAAAYPTPEAVMTGWMNSEGHRTNILNCSLKAIGVGVARASNSQLYWTQDFGGH